MATTPNPTALELALGELFGTTQDIASVAQAHALDATTLVAAVEDAEMGRCTICAEWRETYDLHYFRDEPVNDNRDVCEECRIKEATKQHITSLQGIRKLVRRIAAQRLWEDHGLYFSDSHQTDKGPLKLGPLFAQLRPFLMIEVVFDDIIKPNCSTGTPGRIKGGLELAYYAHTSPIFAQDTSIGQRLADAEGWFTHRSIEGVAFQKAHRLLSGKRLGFLYEASTIPFYLEIHEAYRLTRG